MGFACRAAVLAIIALGGGGATAARNEPGGTAGPPATTPPAERAAVAAAGPSRKFDIQYTATIPAVPEGARRLDLWVPVPSSDAQQTVGPVRVDPPVSHEIVRDPLYGNAVLHAWSDRPAGAFGVTLHYTVQRGAEQALPPGTAANVSRGPAPDDRLLQPDRLGVIDERVRTLAVRITSRKTGTLERARAIYDYVLAHMAYDKAVPGWGNGDTARACEVGKGNCTDFHALFISLARASGIPARFGIGFQVPRDKPQGPIAGYHCWAEFWLPGTGWVPVDASEAWKDPGRRAFYFGGLDDDRVRLSIGRDVRLPGARTGPVNYFLAPVGEADGGAVEVRRSVTFTTIE